MSRKALRALSFFLILLPLVLLGAAFAMGMEHRWWFNVLAVLVAVTGVAGAVFSTSMHGRWRRRSRRGAAAPPSPMKGDYCVLISVDLPTSGPGLLRVARTLATEESLHVTALHLWREQQFRAEAYSVRDAAHAHHPLRPLLESANGTSVESICLVSTDIGTETALVALVRATDLILTGWYGPVTADAALPRDLRSLLDQTSADIALYVARQIKPARRVLVIDRGTTNDAAARALGKRMTAYGNVSTKVMGLRPGAGATGTGSAPGDDGIREVIREAWKGYDHIIIGATDLAPDSIRVFDVCHERLAFETPASLIVVQTAGSA